MATVSDSTVFKTDTHLTANWEINRYTISFSSNGGSGDQSSINVNHGSGFNLPSCNYSPPTDKRFNGWSTSSSASSGSSAGTYISNVTSSRTYYAIWKDKFEETSRDLAHMLTYNELIHVWLELANVKNLNELDNASFDNCKGYISLYDKATNEFITKDEYIKRYGKETFEEKASGFHPIYTHASFPSLGSNPTGYSVTFDVQNNIGASHDFKVTSDPCPTTQIPYFNSTCNFKKFHQGEYYMGSGDRYMTVTLKRGSSTIATWRGKPTWKLNV